MCQGVSQMVAQKMVIGKYQEAQQFWLIIIEIAKMLATAIMQNATLQHCNVTVSECSIVTKQQCKSNIVTM